MGTFKDFNTGKEEARERMWSRVKTDDLVLTLTGMNPGPELRILTKYGIRPDQIMSVDTDPEATSKCLKAMPNIYAALTEDILDTLNLLDMLSLKAGGIFLDFCGSKINTEAVRASVEVLNKGGFLGYTYFRGHDNIKTGDITRRAVRTMQITKASKGKLSRIDYYPYQNGHSPMALAIFQKIKN